MQVALALQQLKEAVVLFFKSKIFCFVLLLYNNNDKKNTGVENGSVCIAFVAR